MPSTQTTPASRIVLGMMRIADLDDQAVRRLVGTARDAGVTTFDHADIYGGDHGCERRFGDAGAVPASERGSVRIQSKVGIRRGSYDLSREHILASVDESLAALRTDHLDLLLLHRPDTLVEPEEVAEAFDDLEAAGKVRAFGVSNHTPRQIAVLRTAVRQPLTVNQVQFGLGHADLVAQGLAMNVAGTAQSTVRDGGLLDASRLDGVTLQAWSPLQSPRTGRLFVGDREEFGPLNDALEDIARRHGVSPSAIAVAWVTRHPAAMQVVVGTTSPERVVDAVAGAGVVLTREEYYALFTAAGYSLP